MVKFELHEKLKSDCHVLGRINRSLLLLMNNSLVPWFIIVPPTDRQEIHELTDSERTELYADIDLLSRFVAQQFDTDKINVAAIGNVVNQMHIHVIGRWHNDYCWPNVVWGRAERAEYTDEEVKAIVEKLRARLGQLFQSANST